MCYHKEDRDQRALARGPVTTAPQLGDTRAARDLGLVGWGVRVFDECSRCHQGVWRLPRSIGARCDGCNRSYHRERLTALRGAANPRFKGGRRVTNEGYVIVRLQPDHPLFCMVNSNRLVFEHRLIMAEVIGRPLRDEEVVHHKEEPTTNNDPNNLELFANHSAHMAACHRRGTDEEEINRLRGQVAFLAAEIIEMKQRMTALDGGPPGVKSDDNSGTLQA